MELDGLEGRDAGGALRRREVVDRAVVRVEGGRGRGVVVAERGLDRLAEPCVRVRDLRGDPGARRRPGARATRWRAATRRAGRRPATRRTPTIRPAARRRSPPRTTSPTRRTPQPLNGMRTRPVRWCRPHSGELAGRVRMEMPSPGRLHDGRAGAPHLGRAGIQPDPGVARERPLELLARERFGKGHLVLVHRVVPETRSSASIGSWMPRSRRSAAMARNWRPRMVPSCRFIATAASFADRPAKNRSSMASRCSGVSRRSECATLSSSWRRTASSSGPSSGVGPLHQEVERGQLATRSDVIDHDIPGQLEQPAPEGDAPRFVARERLQGLDEDELRQVLRVVRADTGGDVAVHRPVVHVEQGPECLGIPPLRGFHETLDRVVVECHNEQSSPVLGPVLRRIAYRHRHLLPARPPDGTRASRSLRRPRDDTPLRGHMKTTPFGAHPTQSSRARRRAPGSARRSAPPDRSRGAAGGGRTR